MKSFGICICLTLMMMVRPLAQDDLISIAEKAFKKMDLTEPKPFVRTTHPDAQWFQKAGLGLFIHWGIHSVAALDPSWAMIKNCPWHKQGDYVGRDAYYRLIGEFNPTAFDPEKWILAAKQAGFQYVVLTAKHHDGYCLWPSTYSEWSTLQYMDGKDLLKPYIDACRKYGLKVGLYFSPRDWGNPNYRFPYKNNDYEKQGQQPMPDRQENQKRFDIFFSQTVRQLSEILTRYGKIDLLWFDGIDWPEVDTHSDKMHAWLREIQPQMVINPRWFPSDPNKKFGDYKTEEVSWRAHMDESPVGEGIWWEFCESWSGHWGYSPLSEFKNTKAIIELLVHARSYGGNYLLNIGPAPDGTMRPGYYSGCLELAKWMKINKQSVVGAQPVPNWKEISGKPMTRNGDNYYLHLLKNEHDTVWLKNLQEPQKVIQLGDGQNLKFHYSKQTGLEIQVPETDRDPIDRVISIQY